MISRIRARNRRREVSANSKRSAASRANVRFFIVPVLSILHTRFGNVGGDQVRSVRGLVAISIFPSGSIEISISIA